MKKSILLLCLLCALNLCSQSLFNSYEKGKIFFRDGSQAEGLLKLSGFSRNEIKYKKSEQDEKQLLTHKKVKSIKFVSGDEYFYKINTKRRKILLIKRELKGMLELFSYQVQSAGFPGAGGVGFNGGGDSMGIGFGGGSSTVYLIGKENSDLIEQLPRNYKKRKFWVIISKYSSGCKEFSDKIMNKNSIKKNFTNKNTAVVDMVKYYNENCN